MRPIKSLDWLEPKLEIQKDGNMEYAYLIAYDEHGNKFTNCSSVRTGYTIRGESIATATIGSNHSWRSLKHFAS